MPKQKYQKNELKYDGDDNTTGSTQSQNHASIQSKNQKNGKAKSFYDEMSETGEQSTISPQTPAIDHVTEVTKDIIQQFSDTEAKLKHVLDLYRMNVDSIEEAERNRKRVLELGERCSDMNTEMQNMQTTIATLTKWNNKKDADLKKDEERINTAREALKRDEDELEKWKHKEKKRLELIEANYAKSQKKALDMIIAEQEARFQNRRKELEKKFHEMTENSKKQLSDSDDRRRELEKLIRAQEEQKRIDAESLKALKSKNEDLELVKEASKSKAQKLKAELEAVKSELGLTKNSPELLQEKFNSLAGQVKTISEDCCQALVPQEWESIHQNLKKLDPCFASLPISGSEESRMLRIAHTQRIIAFHLHNIVLQQFSSDSTFNAEKKYSVGLLHSILQGLSRSGYGRRGPTVFRALAVRGLQSIQPGEFVPQALPDSTQKTRTDAFVEAVLPSLSLLIPKSKHQALNAALVDLANSTVSIWKSAQTDEHLELTASLDLDVSLRKNWRSPTFDPEDTAVQESSTSSTDRRVYTLFPSIIARKLAFAQDTPAKLPESFEEPSVEIVEQDIFIHQGIGMAESSALVLKGKDEQEQKEEDDEVARLRKDAEIASKKLEERNKVKSQRTSSMSGFASPSSSWSMVGGNKKSPEE
ncbi:hypothetical protein QTJ16_000032 [Diplocarpon rosae]|uniref:Uncharacterized protein n=1 Tax=Diplocarpon rosae TaxID=946125 RepID=A0AAD9T5M6_9HELO|nr:hypothetical protein QTJ16_000032 [Diplocarpon rosae]